MTPFAPKHAPFINSGFHLLPLKTKKGGKDWPNAFTQAMTVVVVLRGEVMACTLVFGFPITFGGLCSGCNQVSSTLKIL